MKDIKEAISSQKNKDIEVEDELIAKEP